jgi:hypothetical protein
MRSKIRKAASMIASVLFVSVLIPILVDQGYFRDKPHALPVLIVSTIVFFLVMLVTSHPFHSRAHRFVHDEWGRNHPVSAFFVIVISFAVVGSLLGAIYYVSLRKSQEHLAAAVPKEPTSITANIAPPVQRSVSTSSVSAGLQDANSTTNKAHSAVKDANIPTAEEIANAVAHKTRLRDLFSRDIDKEVVGTYVVFSLNRLATSDDLKGVAGVVHGADFLDKDRPTLSFGVHYDSEEWGVGPTPLSTTKTLVAGMRCETWTLPRTMTPDTKPMMLDDLFVFRFDSLTLDRLEAGSTMQECPFKRISDFANAGVRVTATERLMRLTEKVTLVVNDYVIFELRAADILG